jgi:hypothetical protein
MKLFSSSEMVRTGVSRIRQIAMDRDVSPFSLDAANNRTHISSIRHQVYKKQKTVLFFEHMVHVRMYNKRVYFCSALKRAIESSSILAIIHNNRLGFLSFERKCKNPCG